MMSVEGQLVGMPLAGPESFSQQQLDYLKRAMGVDETVLWEGTPVTVTSGNSITLSEAVSNFDRVIVYCGGSGYAWAVCGLFPGATDRWEVTRWSEDGSTYDIKDTCLLTKDSSDDKKWNCIRGRRLQWNNNNTWSFAAYNSFYILKVVGIHRIAGGN